MAAPLQIATLLGHIQWLNFINRHLFAFLHHIYIFARLLPGTVSRALPADVRCELACVVALASHWGFALDKEWLQEVVATDASQDFGFGVARLRCSTEQARSLGRLAEKRGDYVSLLPTPSAPEPKTRLGNPHLLHLRQDAFRTVLSIKHRFSAHATLLEAHGVRLAVGWIARSPQKHSRRVVLLIDSKAILGAMCKGRTSARSIRAQIKRICAIALAADLTLYCIYIPSEHNPADAPSRGRSIT